MSATQTVVRVRTANPIAGGDVTITYVASGVGTVTPASGQVIPAASITNDIETTGYVDFTIDRPAVASPAGSITFTSTSPDRIPDTDTFSIASIERDFTTQTISTAEIANLAITAAKIGAAAVEEAKVAAGAITEAKLGAAAVTTAKLANLAVTDAILAANAVTTTKITDDAITTAKIAAGQITAAKIAAGTITSNEIAANTIVAGDIAAGTITGTEIAAATITGAKLVANTITAAQIAAGTITATEIAASTITGGKIAALTIEAGNIASNAITTDKLNAGAVTAAKITVSTLSAITADIGDVTAGKLRNSGDTAGVLLSGTLPGTWTTYLNLTATGANPVLNHSKFALNADGTATSNRARCRVYNSANQTISHNTVTALTFDSESFDVDGLHSTASNTSRITIPTGAGNGVWVFAAHVKFDTNGTGARQAYVRKNGTTALGEAWITPSATSEVTAVLTFVESAPTAGDYYEVVVFQTSGGNLDVVPNSGVGTFFAAYHLW